MELITRDTREFKQTSFHTLNFSTVLVVDDDDTSFQMLDKAFEKFSPHILHGKNLLHGLDLLSHHTVDLICLDWRLGDMTGKDFLKLIQSYRHDLLGGRPYPYFVTWSGLSAEKCRGPAELEVLHLGHWQKPMSIKKLENKIETLHRIIF